MEELTKTYAEISGEENFDWRFELMNPEISEETWELLAIKSTSWVSCACGNQCSIIPRNDVGRPYDEELSDLGTRFHWRITDKDSIEALEILDEIEERSQFIINTLINGNNK